MNIAVIGGGIFGCVSAIKLQQSGHNVSIFEQYSNILQAASGINQYRLHSGYHYPRSSETVVQSMIGLETFGAEYGDCLQGRFDSHYYAISKESDVDPIRYINFMLENKLPFVELLNQYPKIIDGKKISDMFLVPEQSIHIGRLKDKLLHQINSLGINLNLSTKFEREQLSEYEIVVNAAYSNSNFILPDDQRIDYQFELCEKPIVALHEGFARTSIVIIDGPFGCIDPYPQMGCHVLGHVEHAIHHQSIGHFPEVPPEFDSYLNSPLIYQRSITKINDFVNALEIYFPTIRNGFQHLGSMYTIRTVLPMREHDDARPSYITKHSDRLYSIFSGKIGTCVDIANELVKIINDHPDIVSQIR